MWVTPGPLRYTELIVLLQGIFRLRSLIQIKLGLMAFFGVYAIGMMTLRNMSDCQPMSPMGQKRTFWNVRPMSAFTSGHWLSLSGFPLCALGGRLRVGKGNLHVAALVGACVRPVCAVHMTAGHNALRGSGPGQKAAF